MRYLIAGQIWSLVLLGILIFAICFFIKKVRKRKSNLPVVLVFLSTFFISCQKSNFNKPEVVNEDQKFLIEDLGFNASKITLEKKSPAKDTLKFANREDAIVYFKYLREVKPKLYLGRVTGTINRQFDPIFYIKASVQSRPLLKTNDFYDATDCQESPWFIECINYIPPASLPAPGYSGDVDITTFYGFSGYNVGFQWHRDYTGNLTSVDNYRSTIVGFTLGVSWDHQSGYATLYPGSALIRWEIHGIQHYNIFIDGVGTFFSTNVRILGIYNINTRTYSIEIA